ncbi:MAG TPA: hypothetical protein VIJ23_11355 [Mycobacterium sp.]
MSRVLALLAAMVAAVVVGCGGSAAPQRQLDEPGATFSAETVSEPIVDLDAQLGLNAGKKQQTIARLFGGDADAWAAFDPKTIVEAHRYYYDLAAWVGLSDQIPTRHWPAGSGSAQSDSLHDWDNYSEDHTTTANQLCELLSAHGAECSVVGYRGGNDFHSAANGFKDALPWLAGRLGTPGVPQIPLPGA